LEKYPSKGREEHRFDNSFIPSSRTNPQRYSIGLQKKFQSRSATASQPIKSNKFTFYSGLKKDEQTLIKVDTSYASVGGNTCGEKSRGD
jgi:hypothetical protein